MARFKFNLGAKVRDTVTDFEGTITARNEWLNGCKQYCLKAKVKKDGAIKDGEWIDEGQLELVRKSARKTPAEPTGGPMSDAPKG